VAAPKIICVTDRKAVRGDYFDRIEMLAAARPHAIMLREKDIAEAEYAGLAARCHELCRTHGVRLIVHGHPEVAKALGTPLHLPLMMLRERASELQGVVETGASVHAAVEAREAAALGAAYLVAGHIFATGSKPDLPPRGTGFLAEVCRAGMLPVFAIGGITPERMPEVAAAGAAGVCIMSSAMICADPRRLIVELSGEPIR
jgi:thiamine-phosphate diphosphorylase